MELFFQKIKGLDYELFYLLNSTAGNSILDEPMMILASDYFIPICLASILVFIWFSGKSIKERTSDQMSVITSMICMAAASLSVLILNVFLFRDRPFSTLDVNLLFYMPTDSSLPANSFASTLAFTLPIFKSRKILGILMLGGSILMGLARIYVGVHYPGDLILAAFIACAAFILSSFLTNKIQACFLITLKVFRKMYLA